GVLVSARPAVGAVGADGLARILRWPTRWIWAAALALSIGLSTAAFVVRPTVSMPVRPRLPRSIDLGATEPPAGWLARTRARIATAAQWFDAATYARGLRASGLSRVPPSQVFVAWGATSLVLAILLVSVHTRIGS